jgi:hypothetical protein
MKRSLLAGIGCVLAGAIGIGGPAPHAQATDVLDLITLFDPSTGAVRDTNGDGLPDTIAAKVIVPAKPAHEDVEGAATIAGRLGYETSAMTLPVVVRDSEVSQPASIALPILVGRENQFVKLLASQGALHLDALKPGQGLIAVVRSPLGGGDGVVAVGADDEGTLAAANELGARLPRVWGMNGISLESVGNQAIKYLRAKGITASQPSVPSVLVDADRRGLASLTLRVTVPAGDADRAVHALQALDDAHRRGQEGRVLDLQNAAVTSVEVVSGGKVQGRASVSRSGLNPRTLTPPIDPDELATDSPGDRGAAPAGVAPAPARLFDLSNAYSVEGWFGDAYADLIPDRTDTTLLLGDASESVAAGQIAARLGLESTGISLPIARPADRVRTPEREPSPILIGRTNPLVERLVKIGKARLDDLKPGEGAVEIVPRAFGNATATVVAGADAAGTEAAASYLARRVPYVWDNTPGALRYDEVAGEVNRFMQMRSAAGQASQAIAEIDSVIDGLKGKTIESLEAKLYLETADARLDAHLASSIKSALAGADPSDRSARVQPDVKVTSQAMTDPVTVFDDTFAVPWEVDEFRARVRAEVLPKVKAGSKVELEARLSEPPQLRKTLVDEVRAELTKAGAADPHVRVLSAYKQGFLWLTEQVIPELKGKGARAIHVKVAEYHPDLSKKYKFYQVPSRWLQELYPADEIVQRELGIPKDSFSLELADHPKEMYTVQATDAAGKVVLETSFSSKFVEREYLEKFPGWSRVDATTGWLRATVDGQTAADSRIKTDPERFWDHYQSDVLPKVYDHVMKVTDNRPMPDKQPFHRDLDVEVWMSEPDFRLGIDEEQVSSLESLHEDLYFVTLDFFDALGRTTTRRRLAAPGKIYPIIHPSRPGQPGEVRVHYAGNASPASKVEISYKEKGVERPVRVTRQLPKIDATPATAVRAVVRADRVSEIELRVEAKDDGEATRAADALDNLDRLHRAGLFKTALSADHVDRIAVNVGLKDVHARRVIGATGESAPSNVRRAAGPAPKGPVVTWDHVISPDESEQIVGELAAFPEVKAYRAGHSYRGHDISVMEITQPTSSELVSHAKLTTFKPTIFITGRQHANEVSSTSHILRLAELLVTDPAYKAILKKVNVILHPVENPDGAQMAFDLQKLTPTHMLHAGRYSALGMDVASQVGVADPLLPEALVRNKIWREWLPDIYLNPHGYPSHEWVQQFAGYVPPGFRTYLSTRGWYTTISTLRDPRYPGYPQAVESLREYVVRGINGNADVRAMDLRAQSRYRKWAYGFEPYVFNQEIYKDTAIYYSDPETGEPSGSRRFGVARLGGGDGAVAGGGRFTMSAWPQVTFFIGGTEAPDETAQGPWLNLAARAGFSYLMANIDYLRDGKATIVRIDEDAQRDGVTRMAFRARPLQTPKPNLPERSDRTTTSGAGGK